LRRRGRVHQGAAPTLPPPLPLLSFPRMAKGGRLGMGRGRSIVKGTFPCTNLVPPLLPLFFPSFPHHGGRLGNQGRPSPSHRRPSHLPSLLWYFVRAEEEQNSGRTGAVQGVHPSVIFWCPSRGGGGKEDNMVSEFFLSPPPPPLPCSPRSVPGQLVRLRPTFPHSFLLFPLPPPLSFRAVAPPRHGSYR